ncbi:hypothetical protein [Botryobacter ruber]|uniref:hypothetical protein n=1 Tax=Botryobacter ruber TaxID=2171629 RepID=UPI000E0BF415|nr:hypothetical protein [Botryobacter ruber]
MKLTQLFSNEFARIEADPDLNFIQLTWLQHVSHAALREVLLKASELARSQGLYKWLFDMRNLNFTTVADKSWSINELFPSFDLRHKNLLACVATPQNVALISGAEVKNFIDQESELAGKVKLEMFINMEAAKDWLFNKEHAEPGAVL